MNSGMNNNNSGPNSFSGLSRKRDYVSSVNDYNTELYRDKKGKLKERVVYIGPMIPFAEEKKTVQRKLIAATVISIALVVTVLFATFCEHTTAWWGLTSLAMAGSLFPCFALITGLVNFPFSAKPMKRDRYLHSIIRAMKSTGIVFAFLAVEIIGEIAYRISREDWLFLRDDIVFLMAIALAIALCVTNLIVLRSIKVDERQVLEYNSKMNI